jgi:hypothetical protein
MVYTVTAKALREQMLRRSVVKSVHITIKVFGTGV